MEVLSLNFIIRMLIIILSFWKLTDIIFFIIIIPTLEIKGSDIKTKILFARNLIIFTLIVLVIIIPTSITCKNEKIDLAYITKAVYGEEISINIWNEVNKNEIAIETTNKTNKKSSEVE